MPLASSRTPETAEAVPGHARTVLARRLADIVCLPSSRITPVERHMAGDLLVEILAQSPKAMRLRCAQRIVPLVEVAPGLLRFLIQGDIETARIVLEDSVALSDSQLVAAARSATLEHRMVIARRKGLSSVVCEALLAHGEPDVAANVLKNKTATLSHEGLARALELSREYKALCALLLEREELRPAQGLTLFWWAGPAERAKVLARFAMGREIMQDAVGDVFAMMAKEDWQDPLVRKTMQFIERRQRNRGALQKSTYDSLEQAIDSALEIGLDAMLTEEIAYLGGIKPVTGAQILTDGGGEPIAILCKATGLKRDYLVKLWQALKFPAGTAETPDSQLKATIRCFDSLSSGKAQTVLRYWNWALSSELDAAQRAQIHAPEGMALS